MQRELSQQEIDDVFNRQGKSPRTDQEVSEFGFRRLDRIPKSQQKAVHLLHEDFARSLSSSLSAYLRTYVSMNLVSLEQISFSEFLDSFPSPTFIAYIGLRPYDGFAVLEIGHGLVFTFIEMLLGGGAKPLDNPSRKITEIEKGLMQHLLRILLRDLSDAWKNVADLHFSVQSMVDEPQALHVLSPAEAVVSIAVEARIGSVSGMINLAFPSIFIKRLRHRFERLRKVHRPDAKERDRIHMAGLLSSLSMDFEARLIGETISVRDLLMLEVGEVLQLNCSLNQRITGLINGTPKFSGQILDLGKLRGFQLLPETKSEESTH
mgnify:CR=1 FL=1